VIEHEESAIARLDNLGRWEAVAPEVFLKAQLECDPLDARVLPVVPEDVAPAAGIRDEPVFVARATKRATNRWTDEGIRGKDLRYDGF
jgi:hypothetical protein